MCGWQAPRPSWRQAHSTPPTPSTPHPSTHLAVIVIVHVQMAQLALGAGEGVVEAVCAEQTLGIVGMHGAQQTVVGFAGGGAGLFTPGVPARAVWGGRSRCCSRKGRRGAREGAKRHVCIGARHAPPPQRGTRSPGRRHVPHHVPARGPRCQRSAACRAALPTFLPRSRAPIVHTHLWLLSRLKLAGAARLPSPPVVASAWRHLSKTLGVEGKRAGPSPSHVGYASGALCAHWRAEGIGNCRVQSKLNQLVRGSIKSACTGLAVRWGGSGGGGGRRQQAPFATAAAAGARSFRCRQQARQRGPNLKRSK